MAQVTHATMSDPRHYLDEIRANTEKMRAQGKVTPTENALFGMIDGLAYSLFMDGSIAAELPQGKVKFASVDELQKYLTTR